MGSGARWDGALDAGGRAQHAAVELPDGRLLDARGPMPKEGFMERFNREEIAHTVATRPMQNGDLPDAPTNEHASRKLTTLLRPKVSTFGAARHIKR